MKQGSNKARKQRSKEAMEAIKQGSNEAKKQ